jgi:SAM-dependent methyltransferase
MFEHVPNPAAAMDEILRVLKPGGVFYLQFDLIWTSPEGNHFSHYVPEPWAHLLCSTEEFVAHMRRANASEADISDFVYRMNRWPLRSFLDLFQRIADSKAVRMEKLEYWVKNREEEPHSKHPNFARLLKLGYSEQDLIVRGMHVCGRRIGGPGEISALS